MALFNTKQSKYKPRPIPPTPPYIPPTPPTPPPTEESTVIPPIRPTHSGNTTVTLYFNNSDNNVLNKHLTTITTIDNIAYKNNVSVMNPEIVIYSEYDLTECNYCYIDTFQRYYYVTNKICTKPNYYTLVLRVDVLMSYKDDIKKCDGILTETEDSNFYNMYLNNGSFVNLEGKFIESVVYPYGFDETATNILMTAGG